MLWYRVWLETRGRFLTALVVCLFWLFEVLQVLGMTANSTRQMAHTFANSPYPSNRAMAADMASHVSLQRFTGAVWSNIALMIPWMLFAAFLGAGGVVAQTGGRGALFTLSLPVSRDRLLLTRVGVGLAELAALALASALMIPLVAPFIGLSYSLPDTLMSACSIFLREMLTFGLAVWLSTIFADPWRPILATIGLTVVGAEATAWLSHILRAPSLNLLLVDLQGPASWDRAAITAAVGALCIVAARPTLMRRDF